MSTIIGVALPPDADPEKLAATENWIIIFAVQPILLVVTLILFYTLVRTDTPRFYITQGEDEKAREVIARIYVTKGDQKKINNILHVEK